VITLKYSMTVALGNIRLRGCCKPWCKAWKNNSGPSMVNTLEGECCVEDALRMVSLEELQNASLC
jgi:hypothetical protein